MRYVVQGAAFWCVRVHADPDGPAGCRTDQGRTGQRPSRGCSPPPRPWRAHRTGRFVVRGYREGVGGSALRRLVVFLAGLLIWVVSIFLASGLLPPDAPLLAR